MSNLDLPVVYDGAIDPSDRQSYKAIGASPAGTEFVYLLSNSTGGLLYVGITWNPFVRWTYHATKKPWWPEVSHARVLQCDDDRHARRVETWVIHNLVPAHNIHQKRRVAA